MADKMQEVEVHFSPSPNQSLHVGILALHDRRLFDDQNGNWSLAPAYDLTFADGPGGEQSMTVNGLGLGICRQHCLILADKYNISAQKVKQIIGEVEEAVAQWPDFAGNAGVTVGQTEKIARSLAEVFEVWSCR